MKENTHHLDCSECDTKASIKYIVKLYETYVESKVGKCENCRYQYDVEGLLKSLKE